MSAVAFMLRHCPETMMVARIRIAAAITIVLLALEIKRSLSEATCVAFVVVLVSKVDWSSDWFSMFMSGVPSSRIRTSGLRD